MIIGSHHEQKIFGLMQPSGKIPGYKSFPSYKKNERKYEPSRTAYQRHMSLTLDVDFDNDSIKGACILVMEGIAQNTAQVTFDARELKISSVEVAPLKAWSLEKEAELKNSSFKNAEFQYSDGVVTLNLSQTLNRGEWFAVKVQYSIKDPKAGFYFVHKGRDSTAKYDCVWTQGQDTDSPYWYPCQDDPRLKMTTSLTFSFPKHWKGLSNGACIEETEKGNSKVQKWVLDKPHAPYLVAFAAGDMHFAEGKWEDRPVQVLVPHEWKEHANIIVEDTKRMIGFFSNYWNYKYAWNKYGQAFVAEFLYGGMENTSITINTDAVLGPDNFAKSSERKNFLVMHELAHQWFGDLVTCETWSEGWLNEGFATLSEMLWDEHENGKVSGIFYAMDDYRDGYLAESGAYMRPIVSNVYEFVSEIFDAHLYNKAAMVLNHLRDTLGEDDFKKSVNRYLNQRAYQPVHTSHLMAAVEDSTGFNPRPFFEQYIYRAGHVVLDVEMKCADANSENIEISYAQKQDISDDFPAYKIDTKLFVAYENGKASTIKVTIDKDKGSIFIPATDKIKFAFLDPNGTMIGKVTQNFPEWMCKNILSNDKNSNGYYKLNAALSLLKSMATEDNCALVASWLKDEPVMRARAVSYKNIAETHPVVANSILTALNEKHPVARAAWVESLGFVTLNKKELEQRGEFLCKIARDEKESLHARQNAVLAALQLCRKNVTFRQSPVKEMLLDLARELLQSKSYAALLEAASLKLINELTEDSSLLKTLPQYLNIEKNPWFLQAAAYQAYASLSARFPEKRNEIRPILSQLSSSLKPIRVISMLPDVWTQTKDGFYQDAFHAYIDRKNYGLLSMLIPRARRARERYFKSLESNAGAEKFVELQDLKNKFALLEAEFEKFKKNSIPSKTKNKTVTKINKRKNKR